METEEGLAELASRIEAVAIAIRRHMTEHGTTKCGEWNIQCEQTLRRAVFVLRMKEGQ